LGLFLCVAEREGESARGFDKFAGSKFARPKGARRVRRMDAPRNPDVSAYITGFTGMLLTNLRGPLLCMAEREDLIRTLCSTNSPGANLNARSAAPKGCRAGSPEYKIAGSDFSRPTGARRVRRMDAPNNPDHSSKDSGFPLPRE